MTTTTLPPTDREDPTVEERSAYARWMAAQRAAVKPGKTCAIPGCPEVLTGLSRKTYCGPKHRALAKYRREHPKELDLPTQLA